MAENNVIIFPENSGTPRDPEIDIRMAIIGLIGRGESIRAKDVLMRLLNGWDGSDFVGDRLSQKIVSGARAFLRTGRQAALKALLREELDDLELHWHHRRCQSDPDGLFGGAR